MAFRERVLGSEPTSVFFPPDDRTKIKIILLEGPSQPHASMVDVDLLEENLECKTWFQAEIADLDPSILPAFANRDQYMVATFFVSAHISQVRRRI